MGERKLTVEGPGETTYVHIAHRAPTAAHPDFFIFHAMDSLLTGPSNLNMFGGGISNKTSRLYQALVERELAVSVHGGLQATIDPFLHTITAIVHPNSSAQAVIDAAQEEIEKLHATAPSPEELRRAVKQARALFAYGSESVTNQGFWLGFAELVSNYEWFTNFLEKLGAVTPEDIQRVAQAYLRPQVRVVGVYEPEGLEGSRLES
jgi:zinc protease